MCSAQTLGNYGQKLVDEDCWFLALGHSLTKTYARSKWPHSPNRACGVGVLTGLVKTPTSSPRGGWTSTLNSKNADFLKIISPLCDQTGGHDAKRTL